jgi:predicted permease
LLLARAMLRAREFAVRAALGATRLQLLRPLLFEALLLALAGGVCAIIVGLWFMDWLVARSVNDHGDAAQFAMDWAVLGWAFFASLVTALAFGLAPALFALGLDTNSTLKSGARGATGSRGHQRFRHVLIVGQFALAMILLAGAALFARGLAELNHRRVGWDSDQLVTGTMLLPAATYPTEEKIAAFQRLALERLTALPGVTSASISYTLPFFGLNEVRRFSVEGRERPEPGHEPAAAINGISPQYFATVGTRVLRGRGFNAADTATAPKVFVINQAMASSLFGDEDPIGRRIARAGGKTTEWGEVVGVVTDVQSIMPNPDPVADQVYQPIAQEPRHLGQIAVRTAGFAPAALIKNIRTTIASLNPDLPVRQLQPAETTITRANYQEGVLSSMLTSLAALGLALAALGIYGVIARMMAQRTTEFGIRLALGARLEDITRLVLTSGAKLALLGCALGLLGALAVARFLAASFTGIHFDSAPVLVGVTLLLIGVALLACWLPARRAAKVDPMVALRAE